MIVDQPQVLAERYRVDGPLGSGGMGTVFAGHDLRLDRAVAIKVLRDDLTRDPSLRRRFAREARSAASVSHPHAVAVYDTGEDDAHEIFIVMERLSGRTLVHEFADGPMDEPRLRMVAHAVLGALGVAHAHGIVHRDVKPGNILLAEGDTVKIGDFGIATSLDAGETTTAVPLGTPAYTAPERLRGFAATERSDLYSLAVVLYEAATGVRPFTGDGAGAVAEAVVAGQHVALGERRPDLSPQFVGAVERALATDPDDRFASAAEMQAALSAAPAAATVPITSESDAPTATAVLPPPARVVAPPAQTSRAPRRSHAWRFAAIAVLLVVLVAAVVLLVAPSDDAPTSDAPASTAPPTTAVTGSSDPVPGPLAQALDRLEEATQP